MRRQIGFVLMSTPESVYQDGVIAYTPPWLKRCESYELVCTNSYELVREGALSSSRSFCLTVMLINTPVHAMHPVFCKF